MGFNLKLAMFKPALKFAMERSGHGDALGCQLKRVGRREVALTFPHM